jgi:hypothetical protein
MTSLRFRLVTSIAILLAGATMGAADSLPNADKLTPQKEMPDLLTMFDGTKIKSVAEWEQKRKPELQMLFQHYMYGYLPPPPMRVVAKMGYENKKAFAGKATLQEVIISIGPEGAPPIRLLLVIPNGRKGPAPCFVGMNFCGNHALVDDPKISLPDAWMYDRYPGVVKNRATDEGRGKQKDVWAIEQTIDRGYAVATFYNGDIDTDRKDVREGIRPFLAAKGHKPTPHDAGTIAVWAWGVQRAVDYLVSVPGVDPKRIISVGHSRLGKTAIVAAAFDPRIALAIPHQAGCGGTAPNRGTVGESVKQINTNFPHWFNDAFKDFNGRPERLPFDQHGLVALCAPRPVLFTNAVEDTWANPAGQFDVLKAAAAVYKLYGVEGVGSESMPEPGKLLDSRLGYFIRAGKHSMTPEDWKIFADFADKQLGKK